MSAVSWLWGIIFDESIVAMRASREGRRNLQDHLRHPQQRLLILPRGSNRARRLFRNWRCSKGLRLCIRTTIMSWFLFTALLRLGGLALFTKLRKGYYFLFLDFLFSVAWRIVICHVTYIYCVCSLFWGWRPYFISMFGNHRRAVVGDLSSCPRGQCAMRLSSPSAKWEREKHL